MEDLIDLLPGRDREIRKWGFTLGAGVDANVGNTNQTAINANMSIRREDRLTRGEIAYNGTFGTADHRLNVNRHRLDNNLDWFFSRYLYWSLIDMPVVYDQFQNIAVRLTPSTGLGWQIFDRPRFELSFELGAGYQYTSYLSTQRFQDSTVNDAALRLSVDLDWDILSDLNLKLSHDTLFIPTDIGQTSNYTRATLKYEITDLFSLETTLVHNRIWEPVADAQGDVPDPDDFQLIVGLSIELQ